MRVRNVEKWNVLQARPEEVQVRSKKRSSVDKDDSDTDFDLREEEKDLDPRVVEKVQPAVDQKEGDAEEGSEGSVTPPTGNRRSLRQRKRPDRFDPARSQQMLSPRERKRKQSLARYGPKPAVRKEKWMVREAWRPPEQEEEQVHEGDKGEDQV